MSVQVKPESINRPRKTNIFIEDFIQDLLHEFYYTNINCLPVGQRPPISFRDYSKSISIIQLLSPTTSNERLKKIIKDSHDMIYYISMLSTTGGNLKVSTKQILLNYNKMNKIDQNKNCVASLRKKEGTL